MPKQIMTYAEAIRAGIRLQMLDDPAVFLMGEDIGRYGGSFGVTKGLIDEFGAERIRDTPISEAALAGTAVGAAIHGMRPVIEVMFSDFVTLTMDQIVNMAAKAHYMYSGQFSVPLVLRAPSGSGTGAGSQHSQSLEAWFCHVPGLKVVTPSTPADAYGLIRAAIRDPNPVIFLEQKLLYDTKGEVELDTEPIPIGNAALRQKGSDLTILSYGRMVPLCMQAAALAGEISAEVLDLRTLAPLDMDAVLASVLATGRVLIVHEACITGGVGAEIAAQISENPAVFSALKRPICRVCGEDIPMPYCPELERIAVPTVERIQQAILSLV